MTILELENEIERLYGTRFEIQLNMYVTSTTTVDFGNFMINLPVEYTASKVLECLANSEDMQLYRLETRISEVLND